ncbi:PQQ-binding-like beta-propeller repeat protein [Luedemannella helvata]|uniref:Pyrrolo-quinoline quinone repeat domain-containing protein n=1 Tax=Luedemannella helvata TaxID=349315 RepID=A0ABN2JX39_9ACTN
MAGRRTAGAQLAALVVVGALVTACTGEEPDKPTPSASATQPPVSERPASVAWTLRDVKPIGQPVNVAGVAVGYVVKSRRLYLVGIDPRAGKELWRKEASPGEVVTGIAVQPFFIQDKVVYQRPDRTGNLYTRIVVADPRTGEDLVVTKPLLVTSPPGDCSDGIDVCTTSRSNYRGRAVLHRLRIADGSYVAEKSDTPPGARLVGDAGLLDLGGRDPEKLALSRDGKLVWQINLSSAFPTGYSTDYGWHFEHYPKQNVYVGTLHPQLSKLPNGSYVASLDNRATTAALSIADGSVRWRSAGTDLFCRSHLYIEDPASADDGLPVRCRYRGTEKYANDTARATFTDLDVTVEGFDIATGDTTWQVPAGRTEALIDWDTKPAIAGATARLIRGGAEPLVLDVATGRSVVPAADAAFWCARRATFDYREPYYVRGKPVRERAGGTHVSVCDARGKASDRAPTMGATAAAGAGFDTVAVVATASGFTGYRAG